MNKDGLLAKNTTPSDIRHLRACVACKLVKTIEQFRNDGCDNCKLPRGEDYRDYTSESFEGLISLIDTQHSWVARINNLGILVTLP